MCGGGGRGEVAPFLLIKLLQFARLHSLSCLFLCGPDRIGTTLLRTLRAEIVTVRTLRGEVVLGVMWRTSVASSLSPVFLSNMIFPF